MTSVPTESDRLIVTDFQLTTIQPCGGMVGVLFAGVVYAVGMLTTITLLGWFVASLVGRVTRGS